jgi:hypothetical protein
MLLLNIIERTLEHIFPNIFQEDYEYIFYDNIFYDISSNHVSSSSNPSATNIQHQSLYETNPNKQVVCPHVLEQLKPISFKHVKSRKEHKVCPITQKKIKKKNKVIVLPCGHCFLKKPILKWLSTENCYCPVCKYTFESIHKNENIDTNITIDTMNNHREQEEEILFVDENIPIIIENQVETIVFYI